MSLLDRGRKCIFLLAQLSNISIGQRLRENFMKLLG